MKMACNGGGGGGSMAMVATAFDDGGYGLRMGDVEVKMAIDTSGGGWFEAKLEIDTSSLAGGDSGRQCLTAVMDEGGHSCLTLASVENRYGVQWWRVAVVVAFNGGGSI